MFQDCVVLAIPYKLLNYRRRLSGPPKFDETILGFPPPEPEYKPEDNLRAAILAGNPEARAYYPHKDGGAIRQIFQLKTDEERRRRDELEWLRTGIRPQPQATNYADTVDLLVIVCDDKLKITQTMLEYADVFVSVGVFKKYIWQGKGHFDSLSRVLLVEKVREVSHAPAA